MATKRTYTGDGVRTLHDTPPTYMSRDHIYATVDGTTTVFSWLNDTQIEISPAPAEGAIVVVGRRTPEDPLVNFNAGSDVTERNLDNVAQQGVFRAAEVSSDLADLAGQTVGLVDEVTAASAEAREAVTELLGTADALNQSVADNEASLAVLDQRISDTGALLGLAVNTTAELTNNTNFTYSAGTAYTVADGDFIQVVEDGSTYEVAPNNTSSYDLETAGGVRVRLVNKANPQPPRGLRAALDALEPLNRIRSEVVLEKRRTDYVEWAVFSCLDAEGADWIRHFSSTRLLPGASGSPDYSVGTLAYLFASTAAVPFGATVSTSPLASSTVTSTVSHANRDSREGIWTGPVTVGGVSDVYYSNSAVAEVRYTVTTTAPNSRIYLTTPAVYSNGNEVTVHVRHSATGVQLTEDEYLCRVNPTPGLTTFDDRITDVRNPNGQMGVYPLAIPAAAGDYEIILKREPMRDATGQARQYDWGVAVTAPIAFDEVGIHGYAEASGDPGEMSDKNFEAGTVFVYSLPNCTKINWRYWQNTVCGRVKFTVYDATGTEISDYDNATLDMNGSALIREVVVASGLDQGDYFLHVEVLKETSNTQRRTYTMGAVSANELEAGTVGVDEFDILDMPISPGTDFGTHVICGPGNHWYASKWRNPSTSGFPVTSDDFTTGVHGEETSQTNADIIVKVDGVVVDYANAAQFTRWVGSEVIVEFTSDIFFPGTTTAFATLERIITYKRGGLVLVETTRTLTADAVLGDDYIFMLQCPNGGDSFADSVGGGFTRAALERSRNTDMTPASGVNTPDNPWSEVTSMWNAKYVNYVAVLNPAEVLEQYRQYLTGRNNILSRQNITLSKMYLRSFGGDLINDGIELPAGHVSRVVKVYRTLPSTDASLICAS